MWVVAYQDGDSDAEWVAGELQTRGLEPVELVSASALVHETVWVHRVGSNGASTVLRLADGRILDSVAVHGLLNRLVRVCADGFQGASVKDREYASGEFQALALSWLEGMGERVINRPSAVGLAGPWRPPWHWRWLARAAGIATAPYDHDSRAASPELADPADALRVLVVDGQAVGPEVSEREIGVDTRRLAAAVDLDIFEVAFRCGGEGWELLDVSPVPRLPRQGDAVVTAVAQALQRRYS
jgi:hypothetical protein